MTITICGSMALRPVGTAALGKALLYRSRQLAGICTEEARFIANDLGICTIYDLRGSHETAAAPEPVIIGVRTIAYTPSEQRAKSADKRLVAGVIGEYGKPGERMERNYRRYVESLPLMGTAIRSIANEGRCALVHCVNGKDRTGVLCATMERLAGMHEDDIMQNYLAANEANASLIEADAMRLGEGMNAEERSILMSFLEARPEYLAAFFDEVVSRFGSFDAYVENHLRMTRIQHETITRLVSGE